MDKEVKKLMVGGYEFNTKEDAQLAKDELNAIKYVSAKTNTKDPKQVYNLYNKIIVRKLFSTQIGMNYLKQLQTFFSSVSAYFFLIFIIYCFDYEFSLRFLTELRSSI